MLPILFALGAVKIYTESVFLAVAFLMMGYVFWRRGREEHYAEDELFDGLLLALVWGVIWSRIGFILLHLDVFGLSLGKWFDVAFAPGFLPLAGVIAGAWFLFRYAKKQKWNAFEILDFAALAVTMAFAIVWLGAFFGGTNFGYNTTLPWGITFPQVFDKRHPTQIYGFALYTVLFFYLSWVEGKYRTYEWYRDKKHSAQTGFLFCVFLIAYGLFGLLLGSLMPPQMVVFGVSLDLPLRGLILVYGCLQLYLRTGRTLFPFRGRK
jgi:phosphatidylglycerol:prolipoprotein diacylglycerol transferase